MAHLKGITLILICICIMQHFPQTNAQGKKAKGRQKPAIPPHSHKKSGSKDPNHNSMLFKGRFANKDGAQCTWAAAESSEADDGAFVLSVSCKNGTETSLHCEFTAKPRLCPEYTFKVDVFWKQIGRSLKKQKKLCRNSKALLKARMCRKAPRDAHFALKTTPRSRRPFVQIPPLCPGISKRQQVAEEYCGSSWSSFCHFFIAMVENDGC